MEAETPALNTRSERTDASRLIFAVRFVTVRSISPTWTEALRKTSGSGTVVETFPSGGVEFVAYTTEESSPSSVSE